MVQISVPALFLASKVPSVAIHSKSWQSWRIQPLPSLVTLKMSSTRLLSAIIQLSPGLSSSFSPQRGATDTRKWLVTFPPEFSAVTFTVARPASLCAMIVNMWPEIVTVAISVSLDSAEYVRLFPLKCRRRSTRILAPGTASQLVKLVSTCGFLSTGTGPSLHETNTTHVANNAGTASRHSCRDRHRGEWGKSNFTIRSTAVRIAYDVHGVNPSVGRLGTRHGTHPMRLP